MPRADKARALLRALPGVDALVTRVKGHAALAGITRRRLTEAARDVLAAERRRVLEGAPTAAAAEALAQRVVTRLLQAGKRPQERRRFIRPRQARPPRARAPGR